MKNKIKMLVLSLVTIVVLFICSGCTVYWDYWDAIKHIDNDYFKTKVVYEGAGGNIIQNEITGEYFLVVSGSYGITITPIQVVDKEVNNNGNK